MVSSSKQVVILVDTTYWGWKFGVVVIKDVCTGKVLWHKFIHKKETLADYVEGVAWLEAHRFTNRPLRKIVSVQGSSYI